MVKIFHAVILLITVLFLVNNSASETLAFQYPSFESQGLTGNLIQNPWFADKAECKFSFTGWNTTVMGGVPLWGLSDKFQDPIDVNCNGSWLGFAARFAAKSGAPIEYYPNQDAYLWQIVQSPNPANKTLHFHFLFNGHRVNKYRAEIFGGNSPTGPWTSVWVPLNITNCLTDDCINNTPSGNANSGDRTGLWDAVTKHFLGQLTPLTKTIPQGYQYYKVQFLANYPQPDSSTTGDVGAKAVRVYFKTSSSGSTPAPTPTPVGSTPTPVGSTPTPTSPASGLLSNLTVADTANSVDWSIQSNLQTGATQYGDRAFTFTSVPSILAGSPWIRTANDSKAFSGTVATFKVNSASTVYVAHNDLITTKPSWLSTYTDTGMNITNSESTPRVFSIYFKTFASGSTVTLGENGGNQSMYTVAVMQTNPTPTGTSLPGDADGNGSVDGLDYIVWLNNYDKTTTGGASNGDFDSSGKVDGLDYLIWLNNYDS